MLIVVVIGLIAVLAILVMLYYQIQRQGSQTVIVQQEWNPGFWNPGFWWGRSREDRPDQPQPRPNRLGPGGEQRMYGPGGTQRTMSGGSTGSFSPGGGGGSFRPGPLPEHSTGTFHH